MTLRRTGYLLAPDAESRLPWMSARHRLNRQRKNRELPEVKEILVKQGYSPAPMSPSQFDAFFRDEITRSARVVKDANLKLD